MDTLFDNVTAQRDLVTLSELPGVTLPSYVAEYTPLTKQAASELEPALFADPDSLEYPIDCKPATWLSAGLFQLKQASGDPAYSMALGNWVWGNIVKAAAAFGIKEEVLNLKAAIETSYEKRASGPDDSQYGWLIKDAAGAILHRRYPMFDADGVMKAAVYFMENRSEYPLPVRREICRNIIKRAMVCHVPDSAIPDAVFREAGDGLPRSSVIMRELINRARMSKDAAAGLALLNLNTVLADATPQELAANLDKLAEIVEDFDHVEQLAGTGKVIPAADFLYAVPTKAAEAAVVDMVKLADYAFSKQALAQLNPVQAFEPVLGPDFTAAVLTNGKVDATKLAAALEALQSADQYALVEHLRYTYA
jgi:hypothetical protein